MSARTLAIRRLRLAVETPAGTGERLARDAAGSLRAALTRKLAQRLWEADDANPTLLLVRRLIVDLDHSAAAPLDDLADRLADAILLGIGEARRTETGGVFFANRAAYTAAFIAALIEGEAWSRWWFAGFDGVRSLPLSAAVRTVLSRDWSAALSVLVACAPTSLTRLWQAMRSEDADQILVAITAPGADAVSATAWSHLVEALDEHAALPTAVAALASVVAIARSVAATEAAAIALVARRAAASWQALNATGSAARPRRAGRQHERTGRHDPIKELPRQLRAVIATRTAESARAGVRPRWRASPLLGCALLLPLLDAMPIMSATRDWPAPAPDAKAADITRLLVLATCAGSERRLWRDPVWRDIFGLPGPIDDAAIALWCRRIGPTRWREIAVGSSKVTTLPRGVVPGVVARAAVSRLAEDAVAAFAARLPGFALASPQFLRANVLGAGGAVLIDGKELRVRLNRPPLDILLGMAGVADSITTLADGRRLMLERVS